MKRLAFLAALAAVGLSGCASWKTSTKDVPLQTTSIAIDAKQRVVLSKTLKKYQLKADGTAGATTYDGPYTCAEPSPDALSVLGASSALSLSKPGSLSAGGSLSLSEAAASIGLRTQSIQLLRDQNYRICEAGSNNQISDLEAQTLLRRNQSTMMGVLAIEQLTGPVVAAQVALTTAATASTGGPSDSEVTAAKAAVKTAETEWLDAQKNLDTAKTTSATKREALDKANADRADPPTDAQIAAVDKAENELAAALDNEQDMRRREAAKEKQWTEAKQDLQLLGAGKSAAGSMSSAEITQMRAAAAASAKELANAVSYIVSETNASYVRDGCFGLVTDLVSNPAKIKELNTIGDGKLKPIDILKATLAVCATQFNRDIAGSFLKKEPVPLVTDTDLKSLLNPGP